MLHKAKKIKFSSNKDVINLKQSTNKNKSQNLLELMRENYAYYGQSNQIKGASEDEYVTREAIISCSLGTAYTKLELCEDHGIIAANQKPLLTCADCGVFKNIHSFGICTNKLSFGNNHCTPKITKVWIQREGNLYIWDGREGKYIEALRTSAYLTCLYGGLITVKCIPSDSYVINIEQYIKYILDKLKWMPDDDEVHEIKEILDDFGIENRQSVECFLLLCVCEAGEVGLYSDKVDRNGYPYTDKYGRAVTEYYPQGYEEIVDYDFSERGVGYLQITWKDTQLNCLKDLMAMGYYNGNINENAQGYVDELRTMPWQTSAWRWAVYTQTYCDNLNLYIEQKAKENNNKLTLGMTLTAECFINGKISENNKAYKMVDSPIADYQTIDTALRDIASGKIPQITEENNQNLNGWYTDDVYLYVGGWRFEAPLNWKKFKENYYLLFPE